MVNRCLTKPLIFNVLIQNEKECFMGIKNIHVILIVASILFFLGFGFWGFKNDQALYAYCSFPAAAVLVIYCIQFIKQMRICKINKARY